MQWKRTKKLCSRFQTGDLSWLRPESSWLTLGLSSLKPPRESRSFGVLRKTSKHVSLLREAACTQSPSLSSPHPLTSSPAVSLFSKTRGMMIWTTAIRWIQWTLSPSVKTSEQTMNGVRIFILSPSQGFYCIIFIRIHHSVISLSLTPLPHT